MRILLVEDDRGLGAALRDQIMAEGHIVDWVEILADARACVETVAYDLVLLDLVLPDGSGIDFLRHLRAEDRSVPLIILTARDRITDRIGGLNAGADDYLVKPFDLAELSARIGSVSRRYARNPNPRIAFGPFVVDLVARSIAGPAGPVDLSQREWVIFETLLRSPRAIVTRSRLEDRLYSFDAEVESNTIEVYVSRLRRKLGRDSVETVRGLGYRLGRP
ncbi:response regulator transcription factor [Amaricoccus sp.]|uniref:response regulator n=1 Tax=Amaricoccus sp. TaxID=1872485 RepID=UPI0026179F31|nr:response regulator transcription factor [uncultured Amaricoccus sp.]